MTLWELCTRGTIPYSNMTTRAAVQSLVCSGGHPQRPDAEACPEYMWEVMQSCWAFSAEDRPTFAQLKERLQAQLSAVG